MVSGTPVVGDAVDDERMRDQLRHRLDEATAGWVVDGNYSATHSVLLPRLDTIILLDFPLSTTFPRLLRRTLARTLSGVQLFGPNGPRERLLVQLFDRKNSLLWYALTTHEIKSRRRRRIVTELAERAHAIVLRSPREVQCFLSQCGRHGA